MEMGVRGFLSSTSSAETIRECLRFSATGQTWMERALSNSMLNSPPVRLSRRQGQLLGLLVQGLKNREIATSLGISEGTVKAYLTILFEKVGARDRFELALFGLKNLRNVREAETERDLRIKATFARGFAGPFEPWLKPVKFAMRVRIQTLGAHLDRDTGPQQIHYLSPASGFGRPAPISCSPRCASMDWRSQVF